MAENKKASAKRRHRPLRIIITIIAFLLLILLGYIAYLFISYKRIPDNQELDVSNGNGSPLRTDTEYKMVTYNAGFGAYEPDFSFLPFWPVRPPRSRAFRAEGRLIIRRVPSALMKP